MMTDARRLKSVEIRINGDDLATVGDPHLSLPMPIENAPPDIWPPPGIMQIVGKFELEIPRDLVKLRSVSPAAKKAFARHRLDRALDAWVVNRRQSLAERIGMAWKR
jgi:hypothetical protein